MTQTFNFLQLVVLFSSLFDLPSLDGPSPAHCEIPFLPMVGYAIGDWIEQERRRYLEAAAGLYGILSLIGELDHDYSWEVFLT
jgi:hypothetical protein